MFKNKNVLVAGGTGLIGIPLVRLLIEQGANVRIASMDDKSRAHPKSEFLKLDLTNYDNCLMACYDMDYVFNLLCAKGSPDTVNKYPASIFEAMNLFNTLLLKATRHLGVNGYMYTSSIGVYHPAEIMKEDDMWKFPANPNDPAGETKRIGEKHVEFCKTEFPEMKMDIVRPANVYGPYDNFDSSNAMVVPSLIKRALTENPMTIWGNGSAIRDFIYTEDAARGILTVAEKNPGQPVNIGSGIGVSIKSLVETIINCLDHKPDLIWDTTKPSGDAQRLLDTSRAKALGFKPKRTLEQGIKKTVEWYKQNRDITGSRYDIFK